MWRLLLKRYFICFFVGHKKIGNYYLHAKTCARCKQDLSMYLKDL